MILKEYIKENKILIIILLFLIYLVFQDKKNRKCVENMSNEDDEIIETIKKYYNPELDSILDLSELLAEYMKKGFTIPGNVIVDELVVSDNTNFILPGSIIAFYGDEVPEGWLLCDGENGTPDLRGRMILGQGKANLLTKRNRGEKGGLEKVVLTKNNMPKHTHALYPGGSHNHSVSTRKHGFRDGSKHEVYAFFKEGQENDRIGPNMSYNVPHTHEIGEEGNNNPHNNMPPFFCLKWIMKKAYVKPVDSSNDNNAKVDNNTDSNITDSNNTDSNDTDINNTGGDDAGGDDTGGGDTGGDANTDS